MRLGFRPHTGICTDACGFVHTNTVISDAPHARAGGGGSPTGAGRGRPAAGRQQGLGARAGDGDWASMNVPHPGSHVHVLHTVQTFACACDTCLDFGCGGVEFTVIST